MRIKGSDGLVGAGAVSRSFLARMPALLSRVGPIKASSYRVARRIANALRAGFAIQDDSSLATCGLIWLAVPEDVLGPVVAEMAAQLTLGGAQLENQMVVLCESTRDSRSLGPLCAAGARVASLNPVPETNERMFVAEGDRAVVAELRRRLAADHRKMIALEPGSKPFYLSGVYLCSHLLLPWIAGAVESLRVAGFSRAEATRLAESLGTRALRSYVKAGSKAWGPTAAVNLRAAVEHDLAAMSRSEPRLAELYASGAKGAIKFFQET